MCLHYSLAFFERRKKEIETHRDKNRLKTQGPLLSSSKTLGNQKDLFSEVCISFQDLCLPQKINKTKYITYAQIFIHEDCAKKNRFTFTLNIYFLQDKSIWFIKQFPSIIVIKTRDDK